MQPFLSHLPVTWKPPPGFELTHFCFRLYRIKPVFILHMLIYVSCLPKMYKTVRYSFSSKVWHVNVLVFCSRTQLSCSPCLLALSYCKQPSPTPVSSNQSLTSVPLVTCSAPISPFQTTRPTVVTHNPLPPSLFGKIFTNSQRGQCRS